MWLARLHSESVGGYLPLFVMAEQSQFIHCLLPELEETGTVFGTGAFGEVIEMKLPDDTKVAGKKVHSIFFESGNDPSGIKSMKDRFEQECVRYKQVIKFIFMYVLCILV